MSKAIWCLAGAVLFLSFGFTEMQGSDLWWHLAAGREIIQTKTLWLVDDWSFSSSGDVWRNHEWLSDLVFYGWALLFGVKALVYWKWLVVVSAFAILQRTLYRQSESHAASFLGAAIAIAIAAPFIDVRPHLYTLLNFSILLYLLLGRPAVKWQLALLFVVWVNLHGGFFFGIMALGILLFPWREFSLDSFKSAFAVGIMCVLVCVINPSGVKSFLYPLTYAFDSSSPYKELGEWHPPFRPGGIQAPYFLWGLISAPVFVAAYFIPGLRREKGVAWEGIVLTSLTLAMALTSRRFIPIFAMSLAVLAAPVLAYAFHRAKEEKYSLVLASAALLLALFRVYPYPLSSAPAYHYLTAEYTYPIDTVDFMLANKLQGNVYALYNWGGYLHWRSDGALKVFIDGRADTIYGAETYLDYVSVLRNRPGWLDSLERSGADYVLWPAVSYRGGAKGTELLNSGRWRFVYQDAVSYLLVRSELFDSLKTTKHTNTLYRKIGLAQINAMRGNYNAAIEFASYVRDAIPYNNTACNVLTDIYRFQGKEEDAQGVVKQCYSAFPSNHLRPLEQ